jgi:hypothetical protein
VVLYYDSGGAEGQSTVVTAQWGPLRGRRIAPGREAECDEYYAGQGPPPDATPDPERSGAGREVAEAPSNP